MINRTTIAKAAAGAFAAALAMGAASAGAQPYGYNGMGASAYPYDACKRAQTERGTAGALIGGGMGAVIGSNAAARNARTEGALLGGLLGAVIGGSVGNKSAACTSGYNSAPPPPPPPPSASLAPPPPPPGYYDRDDYARAERDAYDDARREPPLRLSEGRPDAEGCTLAESPIYMPDGRVQSRFVRVCRDASGKYAVVD